MKVCNIFIISNLLAVKFNTVNANAACGEPRCVGPIGTRNCGAACTDPCTILDSSTSTTFPPSGCNLGSGDCGSTSICVTYAGQQKVSELMQKGTVTEDDCCKTSCFSSMATVVVENKGKTPLKDVKVGEKVMTGSGQYETVYTIDHRELHREEEFLQIYSSEMEAPLELTNSHMLFVDGKTSPIPASKIDVGDAIKTVEGYSTVTKISPVIRNGVWNLITTDGTIVVDGITTSSYSITFGDEHITIAGFKIMSHHDFVHLAMAPYRAMCLGVSLTLCENQGGFNSYNRLGSAVLSFGRDQNDFIQGVIIIGLVTSFGLFSFATSPLGVSALIALLGGAVYVFKNKKNGKIVN